MTPEIVLPEASYQQREAEITEMEALRLPHLYELVKTSQQLEQGRLALSRTNKVESPLPGRNTTRIGERIERDELLPQVDKWLADTENEGPRFVIQGGNRYITDYMKAKGLEAVDLKVMSIDKAPLYNQLMTVLTAEERMAKPAPDVLATLGVEDTGSTRADLLKQFADTIMWSPFRSLTNDEDLQSELDTVADMIARGSIVIPNLTELRVLLDGTRLAELVSNSSQLNFIDDLFYRGRTLYSLAVIVMSFGGEPQNMRLATIGCDPKSRELSTPYHRVLLSHKLYPFENSIRTEQGYWQDVGDMHLFTDMGVYWQQLAQNTDISKAFERYTTWQQMLLVWYGSDKYHPDAKLQLALTWLAAFHDAHGLELNVDKIVDQKGYRIGACVSFAQMIDLFISQEEPVEARLAFKQKIRSILQAVEERAGENSDDFRSLTNYFVENQRELDFAGLAQIFDSDIEVEASPSPELDRLLSSIADQLYELAQAHDRPVIIGINGVDGVGKTEFTHVLCERMTGLGLSPTKVHIDLFTHQLDRRQSATNPQDKYYNHTFDIDSLRDKLLQPILNGDLPQPVFRHADPHNDDDVVEHSYYVEPAPSVVIVEGVFLFRQELTDYFDFRIFLDMPLEMMLKRAEIRDVPRFGLGALIKTRNKYLPAQQRYLAEAKPTVGADIIIEYQDWNSPTLIRGFGVNDVHQSTK